MRMSLAQRVLLTWLFTLVFLIMLVLKLDGKVHWNWFLVFTPVWVFDGTLVLMLAVRMAGRCQTGRERERAPALRRQAWHLLAVLLKLGFCVALCARLHGLISVMLVYVCAPLWLLLAGALLELGSNIFPSRRD
ncbi:transmembrane protein 60 [Clupea harengus]|uniref:Transmembrane protein 60 n=1 Tax=Clupea harengus TaxID=7950 RepID=A0A6P3WBS4_CLUHA|nr:transmembrane protein 60 [Clupea harengus]XP_031438333.1 transmembrane protein 60 [Clupea harengus]